MKKRLLLIGSTGKWAQNYISTLKTLNVDLLLGTRDNWKILLSEQPDGVIVSTPPESHIQLAHCSLERNIPTIIEKPLALNLNEATELKKYSTPIIVNHIHLFSTAYQNLKSIINKSKIEKISSLGFNRGPFRNYSSLWDYGCHDLSLILNLTNSFPNKIECVKNPTNYGNLFKINLTFDNFTSESLVGNGGIKAVRKFKVESDGIKYSIDDKQRPTYHTLALTNMLNVFMKVIDGELDSRIGIDLSLKILEILEYCDQSIINNTVYSY